MKPLRFFFLSLTLASKPKPRRSVSDLKKMTQDAQTFIEQVDTGILLEKNSPPHPCSESSPAPLLPRFPILPPDERGLLEQPVLERVSFGLSFAIPKR